MTDDNLLDDIFKRVDEKKVKGRRGMRKLSDYSPEEREKKEIQLKKMREKAAAVNRAKKQIKLDLLKESNPILYEARQRADKSEPQPAEEVAVPVPEQVVESVPEQVAESVPEQVVVVEPVKLLQPKPVKKREPITYDLFRGNF